MIPRILVVEDEAAIREMVGFALSRNDMQAVMAVDVRHAMELIAERVPDLILLDWMLPTVSGIEFARRLRKNELTREIPIIMLTARGEEDDRVSGLDAGVDDYIVKPFSPRELISRIRAVLRRTHGVDDDLKIRQGELTLDGAAQRITVRNNDQALSLGPTEYRLLQFFMTHAERVYTRNQLLDQVWGSGSHIEDRTVDVHIRRLRKALEDVGCEHYIQTVRGSGYRFSCV